MGQFHPFLWGVDTILIASPSPYSFLTYSIKRDLSIDEKLLEMIKEIKTDIPLVAVGG
jgi:hypothetical protein